MAAYLTNADIARQLDLPESTVRYYRDRFAAYVPMVGEGRSRRYQPEALEVFQVIAEILRNNGTATEVEASLSRMFPRNSGVPAAPQQQDATTQQQSNSLVAEALQSFRIAVEQQAQYLQSLEAEIQQLRAELADRDTVQAQRLKERDEALVATMRRLLEDRQPQTLWQRLFGTKASKEAP